ncbi:MAG: hypothetical protein MZU97_00635 [Bacillus subtilis]|nr:hypothetical protein [Bacillus subtilis]
MIWTKPCLVSETLSMSTASTTNAMLYYFTEAFLEEGAYQVYVFRTADLTITNTDEIFYISFHRHRFLGFGRSAPIAVDGAGVFAIPFRN